MALSPTDELTLNQIIHYWFRYEPKEDTRAAKRRYWDDRRLVKECLEEAVKSGQLKHCAEKTVESLYIPDAPTRYETAKFFNASDFSEFLEKSEFQPPSDSPLLTQWLKSSPAKPQTLQKPFSLNLLKRADDWALAINDMFLVFLSEFRTIPNQTQAWVRLNIPAKRLRHWPRCRPGRNLLDHARRQTIVPQRLQ